MKNFFLVSIFFLSYLACAHERQELEHYRNQAIRQDTVPYINHTDYGCIYYRAHLGDSLMALAKGDSTFILLKGKERIDTILRRDERMGIKDIQIYHNKCIIVYLAHFSINYLALMKSSNWLLVYSDGYEIPGAAVGMISKSHEVKNNSQQAESFRLHSPVLKIISENKLYLSDRFGKQHNIEIDYLNRKAYKIRHFKIDTLLFGILKVKTNTIILDYRRDKTDTLWKGDMFYYIDTLIYGDNILGFVSLHSSEEHSISKLFYTYQAFRWDGQRWTPVIESNIGSYRVYPAEIEEVKYVAYNQVKVLRKNGEVELIEYDLEKKTEKRTAIKE